MQDKKESPKGLSSYMDYKEHEINVLGNGILGWYIDKTLCQDIVTLCNKRKILFSEKLRGFRNYQSVELEELGTEYLQQYSDILLSLHALYVEKYNILKNCIPMEVQRDINTLKPVYKVQKYQPGDSYNLLHCENDGEPTRNKRVLAFMTYLTNIEEAGTHFPLQNFTSKSEQGLTLIWPAYFTHPHVGLPSITKEKVIITGWFTWKNVRLVEPKDPASIFRN